ncbi:hypothetical protein I4U23_030761 [Adineta vaga]|nr:hypothetical protein I4U23_030761 [Adineta vaga]
MDCDVLTNQFRQMAMPSNEYEISNDQVYLGKPVQNETIAKKETDFSDERLNEVKQRLKARKAERESKTIITTPKLISLDEAVQLYNEEKKEAEEHLIQQTTARLLGNMSLSRTTFGLPPTTKTSNNDPMYRTPTAESDDEDDIRVDELGRDKAEINSDHDSDEIDYPDDAVENDDN